MAEAELLGHLDGDLSMAFPLLLKLASAIPPSYYLFGTLLLLSIFLYNFLEFHLLQDLLRRCRGDRVRLTFNQESEIYRGVVSKCRILNGRYLTTPWLASPHIQTTFLNFFGNPPVFRYRRQIFQISDGGTIALDWLLPSDVIKCSSDRNKAISKDDSTPIVVAVPGLTSDSASPYMKHLVYNLAKQGWNVVVSNHRGLGGISITSDCFYNAGWTEDIRVVVKHLHQEYPKAPLFAIGTSLGGNMLVKYLGEDGESTPIAGAACVCSPWDLVICDRFINRKLVQRFYDRALAIGLKGYAQLHEAVLSRMANWEGIKRSCSIRDFDKNATCLVANYETVDTFYRRCSSVNFVGNVSVPLLCISALDDPLCTKEAIPWDECGANKNIVLATTTHGGHLAFFQGVTAKSLWWVEAVEEFLRILSFSPFLHGQRNVPVTGSHSLLESVIDRAPYINVTDDGMLRAMVNDEPDIENIEALSNNLVTEDQRTENAEVEIDRQRQDRPQESEETAHEPTESPGQKMSGEIHIMNTDEMVAPVKKTLNRLQRMNTRSMWLLAYIALVTTWPLVGSVLLIVFKRKLKNILPAAWLRK